MSCVELLHIDFVEDAGVIDQDVDSATSLPSVYYRQLSKALASKIPAMSMVQEALFLLFLWFLFC